jgi:transposase
LAIDLDRTSNIELLRQIAKLQDAEIRRLLGKLEETIARLPEGPEREQLRAELERREGLGQAGGGSERRPRREEKPPKPKREQRGHGPTPQPKLDFEPKVHVLDEADRVCPSCAGELEAWDDKFDDSEEIDVVELQYVIKKHRRQKYHCVCGHIECATGPEKLIPGGRYSLDFAIQVALDRYAMSIPLDRQVKAMKRAGLQVTTQTLWDQLWALSSKLAPTHEALRRHCVAQPVLLADETRFPLLGGTDRATKNWFIWAMAAPDAVYYAFLDGRSNEEARAVLDGFGGTLVVDGYVVYESLSKEMGFQVANDWCHVRRKFIEAESTSDEAGPILDDIAALFLIERELDARSLAPEDDAPRRLELRRERSRPVMIRIGERAARVRALRDSPIAKAVRYLENRWEGLQVFLEDGSVPLTSNGAERALRLPVVGRKNSLGAKSQRGMEVASVLTTLIQSAIQCGLDPGACLRTAALAAIRGQPIPLPHQLRA